MAALTDQEHLPHRQDPVAGAGDERWVLEVLVKFRLTTRQNMAHSLTTSEFSTSGA